MPCAVHAATLDVSSLALSSTMMSCTVHSLMDSLAQPSCTVVYILCNSAPRGSPFELSLGLCSKLPSPTPSPLLRVHVCWFLVFWPLVASAGLLARLLSDCSRDVAKGKVYQVCLLAPGKLGELVGVLLCTGMMSVRFKFYANKSTSRHMTKYYLPCVVCM